MPPGSKLSLLFDFYATSQRIGTLVARAMADSPLRPDEYAIYSVLFDEGPHTPTDLARRAGMPPTTMSHFVRALIERGHASREVDPRDRRSYRLALTEAGLRVHAEAGRAFHEADDRFMAALAIDAASARATLAHMGAAAAAAEATLANDSMQATA
jgi:DNA-binding MarR family transcriptional regulator